MPGMSGRDLAVHARRIRPGVPVIFTSGYTDGEIVRRGLLDAADGYLQKPYTPTGVTEFVQSRLGTRTPA
jgi:CheY-like chemotaxis protein